MKIYSFKATGKGCRINGRVAAQDMSEATRKVLKQVEGYGQLNVNVSQLANQAKALKEWEEKHGKK